MRPLRAIIFDMDDTLYPEESYVLSGFRALAQWAEQKLGIEAERGYGELEALFRQGVRGDTFDRWLISHGRSPQEWVPQMVQVYRRHLPTIEPYSGVPDLLARLSGRYLLGLISDGYLEVQRAKFQALGLAAWFSVVIFADEGGRAAWKPSAWPYRRALEQLGCEPREAIFVADNPLKDFKGAREVGMNTIWLRRAAGIYAELLPPSTDYAPHVTAHDLAELEALIGRWEEERF